MTLRDELAGHLLNLENQYPHNLELETVLREIRQLIAFRSIVRGRVISSCIRSFYKTSDEALI